jgi:hypothetical protein
MNKVMKLSFWTASTLALTFLCGTVAAQSLGDVARQQRKTKKPQTARVYDNDNLPTEAKINVANTAVSGTTSGSNPQGATAASSKAPATSSPEDRQKQEAEWRARVADQKKAIVGIEREIDLLNREQKLRAAQFHGDAGARLQWEKKWADDVKKYEADLASKQQALSEAKQKLEEIRESMRKAGLPSSWAE